MKTRTLVATAVTGALIAGAVATSVIIHQHNQGVAAFDEARDNLAAKIKIVETARDTAAAELAEAQHILDLASAARRARPHHCAYRPRRCGQPCHRAHVCI